MQAYTTRPASVANDMFYIRNTLQYTKPSSIIVDNFDSYEPQLTNLDDPLQTGDFTFNMQHCHNYSLSPSPNQGLDNGCMA